MGPFPWCSLKFACHPSLLHMPPFSFVLLAGDFCLYLLILLAKQAEGEAICRRLLTLHPPSFLSSLPPPKKEKSTYLLLLFLTTATTAATSASATATLVMFSHLTQCRALQARGSYE